MWFKYNSDTGKFETLTNSTLNKGNLSAGYVACDGPGENLIRDIKRFSATVVSDIDLSVIPLVQPICYTVFIVGFVLLLIHITPKMINH